MHRQIRPLSDHTKDCWTQALIELGLNPNEVIKIVSAQDSPILDYKQLYQILTALPKERLAAFQAWEIFCLSGSAEAVTYAITNGYVTAASNGYYGNALHYTARAGSVLAMKRARLIPNIDILATNTEGDNVTNLAAESGNVPALRLAFEEYHIPDINRDGHHPIYRVAIQSAAKGGSLDTMQYVVNNMNFSKSQLKSYFQNRYHLVSVLDYAIASDSLDAIDYANHLGFCNKDLFSFNGYRSRSAARVQAFRTNSPDVMRKMSHLLNINETMDGPLSAAIDSCSITGIVFAVKQLKMSISKHHLQQAFDIAGLNPGEKELNSLRLLRGLYYDQEIALPRKLHSPTYFIKMGTTESAHKIKSQLNESETNIVNSTTYLKWTAPFHFKHHTIHPEIIAEQNKKIIKRGFVIGLVLAIAAIAIVGFIPIVALALYSVGCIAIGVSILAERKIALARQAHLKNSPALKLDNNLPAVTEPSIRSHFSSLTPNLSDTLSTAYVSNTPSSSIVGDLKRTESKESKTETKEVILTDNRGLQRQAETKITSLSTAEEETKQVVVKTVDEFLAYLKKIPKKAISDNAFTKGLIIQLKDSLEPLHIHLEKALIAGICPRNLQINFNIGFDPSPYRRKQFDMLLRALSTGNCPIGLEFWLGDYCSGDKGIIRLAQILSSGKCPKDLKLGFGNYSINDAGAIALTEAISSGKCPEGFRIFIDGSSISAVGISAFAKALSSGRCPKRLELKIAVGRDLSLTETTELLGAISSGKCPIGLKINFNTYFNTAKAILLAEALNSGKCSKGLEIIDFSYVRIGDAGAIALIEAIKSGKCPPGFKIVVTEREKNLPLTERFDKLLDESEERYISVWLSIAFYQGLRSTDSIVKKLPSVIANHIVSFLVPPLLSSAQMTLFNDKILRVANPKRLAHSERKPTGTDVVIPLSVSHALPASSLSLTSSSHSTFSSRDTLLPKETATDDSQCITVRDKRLIT